MKFSIKQSDLAPLQSHSKIITQLSPVLTKTYFAMGDGVFSVFFRGLDGAYKISMPISCTDPTQYFLIDYGKWNNALAKFATADEINLKVSNTSLTMSADATPDVITLGINPCADTSAQAQDIKSCIEDLKKTNIHNKHLICNKDVIGDIRVAMSVFNTDVPGNNSIGLHDQDVMYSDRSIIARFSINPETNEGSGSVREFVGNEDVVSIHFLTAQVLMELAGHQEDVYFTDDYEAIYWEDTTSSLYLSSKPREITLPSDEDIIQIAPQEANHFELLVDRNELFDGLKFFDGFYENSSWKPITFIINKDDLNSLTLYFKQPTAEITKVVACKATGEGQFQLGSEAVAKILKDANSSDTDDPNAKITYAEESIGVRMTIGNKYDVVFAKLG